MTKGYFKTEARLLRVKEDSIKCELENGEEVWVPRSLLSWRCDKEIERGEGSDILLEIPEWKAKELGID